MSGGVLTSDVHADVVIIGAGFSGLMAGALLARRGARVCVLDRDLRPGGCAALFERHLPEGTFRFAVGATLAMGFETGGLMHKLYSHLGCFPRFRALDPAIRVHMNDRRVHLRATRAAWALELERAFPGELRAKRRFWQHVQGLADAMHSVASHFPVLPWRSWLDLLDTLPALHPSGSRILFSLHRTVAQLLEQTNVDDIAHRAFLDGQLLDSMQTDSSNCALPNGAYALEIYRYGAQYIFGGFATAANGLASVFSALGGELHWATRARQIVVDGGRVVGVKTSRRLYRAPVVISTAPVMDTLELLGDAAPSEFRARVASLPELWGAFTLYLGVHESALPDDVLPFEQVTDFDRNGLQDNFLVSTSLGEDRARAPRGYRAVTVSTHTRVEGWFGLSRDQLLERREAMGARLLARLEQLWPRLRSGLVCLETGTPNTFARFTLHSLGRVGGVPQTVGASNFAAIHHQSGIPGLLLAGETIFPGQGTLGVTVSGFNAHRAAWRELGRLHGRFRTTSIQTPDFVRPAQTRQGQGGSL